MEEKVEAWPITGIEMECPKCQETLQELGSDPREVMGYDPETEGEMECHHCGAVFLYYIPD